jgi:ubiquinone/menaquinone biosynthesis C-methylase UbiE
MPQLILALITIAIALPLFYWLIIITEGVFLGRRMVVWLYDITAHQYDRIKEFEPDDEWYMVTRPLLRALANADSSPIILDVASGTGRVPFAMFQVEGFDGYFHCLDASAKMLALADKKLAPYSEQYETHHQLAVPLPFPDNTFDAVTCLEALEFLPSAKDAVQEMVRVLKPEATLLTTRRKGREGRAFLSHYQTQTEFEAMMSDLGLAQVTTHPWQVDYDLVTGVKEDRMRG